MKYATFAATIALSALMAGCGDKNPPPATPSDSATVAPSETASAASSAAAMPTPIATATPTPTPSASPTPAPAPSPTLAANNRCREIETTDWTAVMNRGGLTVGAKAHLRSGGWHLSIADRGQSGPSPQRKVLELVAEHGGGPSSLPTGIQPISFHDASPHDINRVVVNCGPNRIVLLRLH